MRVMPGLVLKSLTKIQSNTYAINDKPSVDVVCRRFKALTVIDKVWHITHPLCHMTYFWLNIGCQAWQAQ
jgi:predicted metallopeptidase